jgi:DNA-binding GntR family transcriptional regulator
LKTLKNIEIETYRQDLEKLRSYLSSRPRDLLLLELLLQKNCTTKEILKVKVKDLNSCKENKVLTLALGNETNGPIMTASIKSSFKQLLLHGEIDNEQLLFKSRKGDKQLTTTSVSRLIRTWLKKVNLTQYKGLPELRQKLGPLTIPDKPEGRPDPNKLTLSTTAEPESIQQIVYKHLVKNIISGAVAPGQRLFPNKIAKLMNVSTTPVREALSRLEAKGFATHHEKRGWAASELSKTKFKEIFNLRILLECEAISLAATRRSQETLKKIETAQLYYEQVDKENDPVKLLEANRVFHMLVYRDAGSEVMQTIINQLWDLSSPYHHILFRQSILPKPTVGIDHHIKIVQALSDKKPEDAMYWLKEDIVKPVDFIIKLFNMYAKSIE